jgi:hypothetical protein
LAHLHFARPNQWWSMYLGHMRTALKSAAPLPPPACVVPACACYFCCTSVPLPPIPQHRAMGYEPHVVPGVPSYTPLEKDRGLRAGAAEELALGDAEPRLDDRWVWVCMGVFFRMHRSHSISFTRAEGVSMYKIGCLCVGWGEVVVLSERVCVQGVNGNSTTKSLLPIPRSFEHTQE